MSKMNSNRLRGEAATLKERWTEKKALSTTSSVSNRSRNRCAPKKKPPPAPAIGKKRRKLRYGKLAEIEQSLTAANHEIEQKSGNALLKEEIDEEDIAKIVAKWTGIPVARMLEGEVQKLINMEARSNSASLGRIRLWRLSRTPFAAIAPV